MECIMIKREIILDIIGEEKLNINIEEILNKFEYPI
jgi:hypothetical protein